MVGSESSWGCLKPQASPIGTARGGTTSMIKVPLIGPGGLRLLLATAVFISHTSRYNIGRPAVAVFFMLSGYWVTRLYTERSSERGTYLLDRIMRVWPLLAVTAASVVALKLIAGETNEGSLSSTLLLLGLATRHGDVLGVTWSLDIELQFYIALPMALWLVEQLDARHRVVIGAAMLASVFALGVALDRDGVRTMLLWAPAFAAGALIFVYRPIVSGRAAAIALLAFAALMALPSLRPLLIKGDESWWNDPVLVVVCLTLVPFIAWNLAQRSSTLDRHLGNLSFPFYLVHFPIVHALTADGHSTIAYKAAALLVSAVLALALYILVDRPLDHLRKVTVGHWRERVRLGATG